MAPKGNQPPQLADNPADDLTQLKKNVADLMEMHRGLQGTFLESRIEAVVRRWLESREGELKTRHDAIVSDIVSIRVADWLKDQSHEELTKLLVEAGKLSDRHAKYFDYTAERTKQLLTLAAAIVGVTIAFADNLAFPAFSDSDEVRQKALVGVLVIGVWLVYLLSIAAGIQVLSKLPNEVAEFQGILPSQERNTSNRRIVRGWRRLVGSSEKLQVTSFFFATISLVVVATWVGVESWPDPGGAIDMAAPPTGVALATPAANPALEASSTGHTEWVWDDAHDS